MALDIDEDVGRKITKFALIGYAFLFFLAVAQPLLCFTLMGLLAIAPILLGPNPMRILGLLAFGVAGYLFWPEYQESKKVPARNEVRQALLRADPVRAAVAKFVADNKRLPAQDALDIEGVPDDDQGGLRIAARWRDPGRDEIHTPRRAVAAPGADHGGRRHAARRGLRGRPGTRDSRAGDRLAVHQRRHGAILLAWQLPEQRKSAQSRAAEKINNNHF